MGYKIIFSIFLLFVLLTSFMVPKYLQETAETKKWLIEENSSLCVNGSTNVNKFSCEIPAYDQTDTLFLSKGESDKEITLSGSIKLKVKVFDCHNPMMTRDLQKILKEKQFPVLHIGFLSLSKLPYLHLKPELITGMVNIEIAGTQKSFRVNYQISQDDQKVIHLLGSRAINFSDFNLIPPKKFGGLVKTKDKLSVDFNLNIKAID